jgi:hypothetical protein
MNWCFAARSQAVVQREQLKIILRDFSDERNHHVAPRFFARKNCARADSLSRRMRPHKSISHEAFTSAAKTLPLVPVGDGVFPADILPAAGICSVIQLREKSGARFRCHRARLLDARDGNPQIVIVGERGANQALQRVIMKNLPPRKIGE